MTLHAEDWQKVRYHPGDFRLGRLIDVRSGARVLTAGLHPVDFRNSAVVVGPTTKGKTTSVIAPWIASALNQGWSCIAVDVRGDLSAAVQKCLRRTSGTEPRLVTIDYLDRSNVDWNWIDELLDGASVEPAVGALLGRTPPPRIADPALWHRDVGLLRAVLQQVDSLPAPRTTEGLIGILSTRDRLESHMLDTGRSSSRLEGLMSFSEPEDYARRTEIILSALEGARSTATTGLPPFRLKELFAEPTFLCVPSPLSEEPRSISFAALVVSLALSIGFGRFGSSDGRPVLLAVDEAARMSGRLNLEELTSMGAGAGLRTLLSLQYVEQLQQYGLNDAAASALLSNADTMIVMNGASTGSVRVFAERFGIVDTPFSSTSTTNQNSFFPSSTRETRLDRRLALGDREIREPPFGDRTALVHSRAVVSAPFVVDLTRDDMKPASI